MKYLYGKRIKTLKDRVTTLVASLAILANSAGVALPVLLTQKAYADDSIPAITNVDAYYKSGTGYTGIGVDFKTNGLSDASLIKSVTVSLNNFSGGEYSISGTSSLFDIVAANSGTGISTSGTVIISGSRTSGSWSNQSGSWHGPERPDTATVTIALNDTANTVLTNSDSNIVENSGNTEASVFASVPAITYLVAGVRDTASYKGISVNTGTENITDAKAISVTLKRADGSTVVKNSRPAPSGSVNGVNSGETTTPFIIQHGTYNEAGSTSWFPAPATWNKETRPTEVTVLITLADDTTVSKTTLLSINQSEYEALLPPDTTAPNISWQLQPEAIYGIGHGFHVRPITSETGTIKSIYFNSVDPANLIRTLDSNHKNFDTKNGHNQSLWDNLPDGTHKFVAVFEDYAGNITTSESSSFIVDRTAPTITVKDGYTGDITNKIFSSVSFKLYDAYEVDKYVINGYTSDFSNNKWSDANFQNIKNHLIEGENTLTLYDVAGNSTTYKFTYDSTAPAVPTGLHRIAKVDGEVLACSASTQRQILFPTWDANTEADLSHYEYTSFNVGGGIGLDGQAVSTNQFVHNWMPPTEGTTGFKVRAVDMAGNKSAWTDICYVTYDSTNPDAPTGFTLTGADGIIPNGGFTNSYTVVASWNSVPDADGYEYRYYNSIPGDTYNDPNFYDVLGASTSRSGVFNRGEGLHHLQVRAYDAAGNWSGWTDVFNVTYDATAPEVSGVVLNGESVNVARSVNCGPTEFNLVSGTINLSATITDNLSGVNSAKYKIRKVTNGGCTQAAIYQSSTVNMSNSGADEWVTLPGSELDTAGIPEGNYTIQMTLTDNAGNTATKYVDITVDNTAPTAPVITAPGARTWHKTTPIVNSWSVATDTNGISTYQVAYLYDDGHIFGGSTCPGETINGLALSGCRDTSNLSRSHTPNTNEQGGVTIWVRAIDKAGNKGTWSKSVHYYYDSVAPVASIVAPTGVVGNNFIISGEASDNLALNRVYVQLNKSTGGRFGGTTIHLITNPFSTSNSWSKTYDVTALGLADGDYRAHVSVTDMAGNTSSAGWTDYFTVDTTAPVVLVDDIDEINTGSNAVVTGSIDDPSISSVEILVNGVLEDTAGVTAGAFSFNVSGLGVGTHPITVRATDDAGNVGEDTKSVSVGAVESAFTNTPGGSEEAPNINTASTSRNPSTTSNVTITDNNSGGDTLVEQTAEEPEARVLQATDTANGSDTSGENETEENNGCGKFLGLCWYLWIPIVIAVLGTIYYVSSRRADEK